MRTIILTSVIIISKTLSTFTGFEPSQKEIIIVSFIMGLAVLADIYETLNNKEK